MDSIKETTEAIKQFVRERDWEQFHNPKDMAVSIALEAGELLENFQWDRSPNLSNLADECVDVAIYLFELADMLGIDLLAAIREKLVTNAMKYPVKKAKGKSLKYDKL